MYEQILNIDLPVGKRSGLKDAVSILKGVEDISVVRLTKKVIVRHNPVQDIVKAYKKN
jgi:phosphate starvation-inducible PhoH-like protein